MYTVIVDTLLNFPMQFDIILTYTNTSRLNAFRRLLVELKLPELTRFTTI